MIVTVPAPEFFSVMVCWLLPPTTTLPKLKLPGFAESVPLAATALPVKGSVWLPPGALSAKTTLPVMPVVDAGVNCTLKAVFCPAVNVFGRVSPVIANPLPETVAADNTRSVFPLLDSVTFCELVWPTVMLLKFKAEGEIVSADWVPVPLSETASGESVASLTMERAPVAAPEACGANWTCTVVLCPAGTIDEGLPPTTLNAAPEIAACEMSTVTEPVFVTVRLTEPVLPTGTLPKLRLAELAESVPAPLCPVEPLAALVV